MIFDPFNNDKEQTWHDHKNGYNFSTNDKNKFLYTFDSQKESIIKI